MYKYHRKNSAIEFFKQLICILALTPEENLVLKIPL